MENFALVTGSSKGIGLAIARSLARRHYNLILVARSEERLRELSSELSDRHGIHVHYFPIDLSLPGAALAVSEWCKENQYRISILVNNAGYGVWGRFEDSVLDEQLNMLRLNMNTVVELTHYILPVLRSSQQAYIMNIASTAAYQALPTFSLYAASKAFVLSFSRALRFELAGQGISVTCVSPGPVDTDFANRAGLSALAETAAKFNMMPDTVAEIAVRGMLKKRAEIIPGFTNKISAFAARIFPKSLLEKVAAGIYKTSPQSKAL